MPEGYLFYARVLVLPVFWGSGGETGVWEVKPFSVFGVRSSGEALVEAGRGCLPGTCSFRQAV